MMTPRSSCPGGESTPLQGANLRLNYGINNVTDTALGNLARGTQSFWPRLSYRPPGSLLESRGGSIPARAEGERVLHDERLKFEAGRSVINFVLDAESALLTSQSLLS